MHLQCSRSSKCLALHQTKHPHHPASVHLCHEHGVVALKGCVHVHVCRVAIHDKSYWIDMLCRSRRHHANLPCCRLGHAAARSGTQTCRAAVGPCGFHSAHYRSPLSMGPILFMARKPMPARQGTAATGPVVQLEHTRSAAAKHPSAGIRTWTVPATVPAHRRSTRGSLEVSSHGARWPPP